MNPEPDTSFVQRVSDLPEDWLHIDSMDLDAQGIARRLDGKVVFIDGALPGELVSASVNRRKNHWEAAALTELHRESSLRVRPRCPHFGLHQGACGGCKMQHLDTAAQVAVKQRALEDQLWHLGKVKPELILLSAGYDAHWMDPLASMGLSITGYMALVEHLLELADELCGGRLVCVLEGGYHLDVLSHAVLSTFRVLRGDAGEHARFRLGGMVAGGSFKRAPGSMEAHFRVTDGDAQLPVMYDKILPDLFREGQAVVATGTMRDGVFVAENVLAKHDETYMPKAVADKMGMAHQKHDVQVPATAAEPAP